MKELTKAEEQIMQILWNINKGFVKDIVDQLADPKPAYNTVSTIVRILEKKGFVKHIAYGKTHEYYPAVSKDSYSKDLMHSVVKNYFSNSFQQLVSFFTNENNLTIKELEEIKEIMELEINRNNQK